MSSSSKFSSIPMGAKVICTDGAGGKSTALVVDPGSRSLTHIAVVEASLMHGEERLVPVEKISKTTRDEIYLNCTKDELLQMPSFTRTHYLEFDQGGDEYAYSLPYMSMSTATMGTSGMVPEYDYVTVKDYLVPEGEIALHRGMFVEALDGSVGEVGELLLDPKSGQITHFTLMKGHGWGKKEIAIQTSLIGSVEEETVHLKIDKEKISQLPSLPVKRTLDEVSANELELMVWVFTKKNLAQGAYQQVTELSKQYAIDLLNATMLEKDSKGDIQVRQAKKAPSRRRVALGVALGGLAGLVIGPVALAAGIVAGGVAGKKSAEKIEVGFSEAKLRKLDESLAPGGSALVLLVEHRWYRTLQTELAEQGGQLIHERLSNITLDELMSQLPPADTSDEKKAVE